MSRRRVSFTVAALVGASTLLTACGGADESTTSAPTTAATPVADSGASPSSSPAPIETLTALDTAAPDTAAVDTSPAASAPPTGEPFEVCPTIPSLDVINTVLDEPATRAVELERGPATAICEAGSETGIANVQFTRALFADRELTEEIAAELGTPVTDLNDPELPGGFTYSAVALIIIDEVEYSVQVITLDTITNPDSPEATQRSATLLKAWLATLGIG